MGSGYWIVGYAVRGEECFERGTWIMGSTGVWDKEYITPGIYTTRL